MNNPAQLQYTKEHEWIAVAGDLATIGITDHAQHELGDVVFVELPEPGLKLKGSESFGSVESVKAVSEVYSPVSGEVTEINEAVVESPELINQDPYGRGWMIKVKLSNSSELKELLSASQYENYVQQQRSEA